MYLKDKIFQMLQKVSNITDDNSFPIKNDLIELYNDNTLYLPQKDNSLQMQLIDEILYAYNPKKGITIIRTLDCEQNYNNCACNLIEYLEEKNNKFKVMDQNLVVNLSKVVNFDSSLAKVYFSKDRSISVPANTKAISAILNKYIGTKYDIAKERIKTNGEYYPISK